MDLVLVFGRRNSLPVEKRTVLYCDEHDIVVKGLNLDERLAQEAAALIPTGAMGNGVRFPRPFEKR